MVIGIILAGGTGSRLWPLTISTSKQLLPVFDKPLIYYPLATLMSSGIREICLITTPSDQTAFRALLGDGAELGIKLNYVTQTKPEGLAQAFQICEDYIEEKKCALILGDNLFDTDFKSEVDAFENHGDGAQIFAYRVNNPEDYGVVLFDENHEVVKIVEKPKEFVSEYAVPGIYFYDSTVISRSKSLHPSERGELEITDLHMDYLGDQKLRVSRISQSTAWLDTGSFESLNDASQYVRIIEERKGHKIGCVEEIAWHNGWISKEQIEQLSRKYGKNSYGKYLEKILRN